MGRLAKLIETVGDFIEGVRAIPACRGLVEECSEYKTQARCDLYRNGEHERELKDRDQKLDNQRKEIERLRGEWSVSEIAYAALVSENSALKFKISSANKTIGELRADKLRPVHLLPSSESVVTMKIIESLERAGARLSCELDVERFISDELLAWARERENDRIGELEIDRSIADRLGEQYSELEGELSVANETIARLKLELSTAGHRVAHLENALLTISDWRNHMLGNRSGSGVDTWGPVERFAAEALKP